MRKESYTLDLIFRTVYVYSYCVLSFFFCFSVLLGLKLKTTKINTIKYFVKKLVQILI